MTNPEFDTWRLTNEAGKRTTLVFRVTDVYRKINGRWLIVHEALCDRMAGLSEHPAIRTLGVTDADLFTPGANYVFSCAKPRGRGGVMSVSRLRDPADPELTRARYQKIVLRAVGLMWGFRTSPDRRCVMAYSDSLADLDAKGTEWCGHEPADVRRIEGLPEAHRACSSS